MDTLTDSEAKSRFSRLSRGHIPTSLPDSYIHQLIKVRDMPEHTFITRITPGVWWL